MSASGARSLRRIGSAALPVGVAALDGLVVNAVQAGPVLWGALAAAGALVLRRRQPELALAAGIPGLYLGHLAFAPLIALHFLAAHRRSAVPGAVGAVLVALAQFLPVPIGDIRLLRLDHDTVLDTLDSCAFGAGAFVLGRSARQRRERLREITESREREHRLLERHTLAAERARLAREMHDVVAHKVSLISLQAGVIQVAEPDAPAVREAAGTIRDLSVDTLTELQHLVGVLRADGGNTRDLAPQPRIADLGRLVEESALPVELHLGDLTGPLPEAVERAAYRTGHPLGGVLGDALDAGGEQEAPGDDGERDEPRGVGDHGVRGVRPGAHGLDERAALDAVLGGHGLAVRVLRPGRVEGAEVGVPLADQDAAVLQLLGHRVGGQVEREAVLGRRLCVPQGDQGPHAVPVRLHHEVEALLGVGVHDGPAGAARGGGVRAAGQTEPDGVLAVDGLHRPVGGGVSGDPCGARVGGHLGAGGAVREGGPGDEVRGPGDALHRLGGLDDPVGGDGVGSGSRRGEQDGAGGAGGHEYPGRGAGAGSDRWCET